MPQTILTQEQSVRTELDSMIQKALQKLSITKENQLCQYIPGSNGGYIHHFSFRKMKTNSPKELIALIDKYILQNQRPSKLEPKPRASRGSRKRKGQIALTKPLLEKILQAARVAGDKEVLAILSPRRSIASCRRELIQSIKQGKADSELWQSWVDSVSDHNGQ